MTRKRISSASPFEKSVGFSRAVCVGDRICVSGTAPIGPDGQTACVGDAYGQARRCLEVIAGAIVEAGGSIDDVVVTRMYITDRSVWEDVARAHGEFFSEIRPASTMVVVASLLDPDWFVEIEAEAVTD